VEIVLTSAAKILNTPNQCIHKVKLSMDFHPPK